MNFVSLSPVDANDVFRAMLQTLSQPGTLESLTLSSKSQCPTQVALLLSLIDVETKFSVVSSVPEADQQQWTALIHAASGAPSASESQSEWVLSFGEPSIDILESIPRGTPHRPEMGCRLIVSCSEVRSTPQFESSEAEQNHTTISLRGPGIETENILHVAGLSQRFFEVLHDINGSFPAGIDVWLCDQFGNVSAISRSTEVNVVTTRIGVK
ncbi:MAG: phosphonate C-P lyase system protein PhnH [Actinomycetota bacterium]